MRPLYNKQDFIVRCLTSLVRQTHTDIRICLMRKNHLSRLRETRIGHLRDAAAAHARAAQAGEVAFI